MRKTLAQRTTSILTEGLSGNIELMFSHPHEEDTNYTAVICHPHPLFEGSMHNKVVTTLAKCFDELGMSTIRFNFRGVGKSNGKFDNAKGECDDLHAVIKWSQQESFGKKYFLAGFSFGSYICAKTAHEIKPEALITVAPAVLKQDYSQYPIATCPWWVIQGDEDEITSADAVFSWAKNHPNKPNIIKIRGASHFFHGKLGIVEDELSSALVQSNLVNPKK
ncbi:MAG: alpha/beta family hydrolase [Pseudomonadota bacterium]|nr:alpha/beta family hydrolase [Pseudomonadota bacterium]